jgi:hypothetical protein
VRGAAAWSQKVVDRCYDRFHLRGDGTIPPFRSRGIAADLPGMKNEGLPQLAWCLASGAMVSRTMRTSSTAAATCWPGLSGKNPGVS